MSRLAYLIGTGVRRWLGWAVILCVVVAGVIAAVLWAVKPDLPAVTEGEVREAVFTAIQREAAASFYVTGAIDVTATTTVRNRKTFLPGLLDLNMGETTATVRLPGRVYYGFDVSTLEPQMIALRGDSIVEVTLPELRVHSVEPNLSAMEVETSVGWARLESESGQRVERQAITAVERSLRNQGTAYLNDSTQPRVHTAEAMETLLTPVLRATGIQNPRFRFRLGSRILMEP